MYTTARLCCYIYDSVVANCQTVDLLVASPKPYPNQYANITIDCGTTGVMGQLPPLFFEWREQAALLASPHFSCAYINKSLVLMLCITLS